MRRDGHYQEPMASHRKIMPHRTAKIGIGKVICFFMTNERLTCNTFMGKGERNRQSLQSGASGSAMTRHLIGGRSTEIGGKFTQ
jgi:hypothetical protein